MEGILYPDGRSETIGVLASLASLFYPPSSWMFGAALGTAPPGGVVPGTFIWLVLVAAGISMWKLACEWLPGGQAAAATSLAMNPYHLVFVYYPQRFYRAARPPRFGPSCCGQRCTSRAENRARSGTGDLLLRHLAFQCTPAVIATYSLVLLMAVACTLRRSTQPAIAISAGMTGGFGLAAFYIFDRRVGAAMGPDRPSGDARSASGSNFSFTHSNDPEFLMFNWKMSAVAMGVMLVAGMGAVSSRSQAKGIPGGLVAILRSGELLPFL